MVFSAIKDALESVEAHTRAIRTRGRVPGVPTPRVTTQMFSDSISLSVLGTGKWSFAAMTGNLMLLQTQLLLKGFLWRGALAGGLHYEKGKVMFGPAMIAAVNL
jgi:hypothetical protein